jgi:hypothetical protein
MTSYDEVSNTFRTVLRGRGRHVAAVEVVGGGVGPGRGVILNTTEGGI